MTYIAKIIAGLILLVPLVSQATIIEYEVGNATGQHGLYTFGKQSTGSAAYSIQDGTSFIINASDSSNILGRLVGTANNSDGDTARFDVLLSGFAETSNYKKENGKDYSAIDDIAGVLAAIGNGDIDFFTDILGTVSILDYGASVARLFDIATCTNCADSFGLFGFQFGEGANGKNSTAFGAAAWVGVGTEFDKNSHWDFNLTFSNPTETSTSTVNGPSVVALFLLGLAMVTTRKFLPA